MADTTTPQARLQLGQLRAITEPAALACLSPAARADLADILAQALGQIHRLNRPDGNHAPLVQIIVTGGDADSEFYVRTIDEPWPGFNPARPENVQRTFVRLILS